MSLKRRQLVNLAIAASLAVGITWTAFAADPASQPAAAPKSAPTAPSVDQFRLTGPYVHQNLAIYLLHSDQRDDREFLTLNEGLKSGLVKVSELDNEQVNRLQIENLSDKPLFLQEGDRVTGGKQDRTIYSSLILAAKSGRQAIPSFCIEPSRWSGGKVFKANPNAGYASNTVRKAAKLAVNQGEVWNQVGRTKTRLSQVLGTRNTNTSLNEAIDSKKITEATNGFKKSLGKLFDKHQDAVGFTFAVNGQILEVNAFPGKPLAAKIYPRMLETYAVDAVVAAKLDKEHATAKAPTKEQVLAFMKTPVKAKADRKQDIDADNQLVIFSEDKVDPAAKVATFQCQTSYEGKLVHRQWIKAEKMSAQGGPRQASSQININQLPVQNDAQQEQQEVQEVQEQ